MKSAYSTDEIVFGSCGSIFVNFNFCAFNLIKLINSEQSIRMMEKIWSRLLCRFIIRYFLMKNNIHFHVNWVHKYKEKIIYESRPNGF